MIDGLDGLRHHPVIGGHYQNGNIGDIGTVGPHGGEGFVAGRVQEGYLLVVHRYLVGPDMLGNATGLGIHDVGLSDGIKQLGLAVIDVSHYGHHRGAGLQVFSVLAITLFLLLTGFGGAGQALGF